MITNKNPLNQSAIIDWIYNNLYIFSTIHTNIAKQPKDKFGKALTSFRKYVSVCLRNLGHGIKLDKVGTIYSVESSSSNKKKIITPRIKYSSDFLMQFTQIQSHKHSPIKIRQIDYEEIAGQVFLEVEFVKFAINSYFCACLQLALLEQDRKVIIGLGVGNIQIFERKARFRQVSRINDDKQNIDNFFWHMLQKNDKAQLIWKQSLQGTINQHLDIKKIKDNFDKGAATTYKYNQLINSQHF